MISLTINSLCSTALRKRTQNCYSSLAYEIVCYTDTISSPRVIYIRPNHWHAVKYSEFTNYVACIQLIINWPRKITISTINIYNNITINCAIVWRYVVCIINVCLLLPNYIHMILQIAETNQTLSKLYFMQYNIINFLSSDSIWLHLLANLK